MTVALLPLFFFKKRELNHAKTVKAYLGKGYGKQGKHHMEFAPFSHKTMANASEEEREELFFGLERLLVSKLIYRAAQPNFEWLVNRLSKLGYEVELEKHRSYSGVNRLEVLGKPAKSASDDGALVIGFSVRFCIDFGKDEPISAGDGLDFGALVEDCDDSTESLNNREKYLEIATGSIDEKYSAQNLFDLKKMPKKATALVDELIVDFEVILNKAINPVVNELLDELRSVGHLLEKEQENDRDCWSTKDNSGLSINFLPEVYGRLIPITNT